MVQTLEKIPDFSQKEEKLQPENEENELEGIIKTNFRTLKECAKIEKLAEIETIEELENNYNSLQNIFNQETQQEFKKTLPPQKKLTPEAKTAFNSLPNALTKAYQLAFSKISLGLLDNELSENDPDISNYIWLVKQGLFYEYIISKFPSLTRKDAKLLTYKVLFGHNGINSTDNKIFESLFPKVYNFIIDYKSINEDYKSLSHVLQKMESDFIYGKVVKEIYAKIKNINLITIHDSIYRMLR